MIARSGDRFPAAERSFTAGIWRTGVWISQTHASRLLVLPVGIGWTVRHCSRLNIRGGALWYASMKIGAPANKMGRARNARAFLLIQAGRCRGGIRLIQRC